MEIELCNCKISNEPPNVKVEDLIEQNGVLTTSDSTIHFYTSTIQIPSAQTSMQECKDLFNYKLSRKQKQEDSEEESVEEHQSEEESSEESSEEEEESEFEETESED